MGRHRCPPPRRYAAVDTLKGAPSEGWHMTDDATESAAEAGIWARTTAPQSAFTMGQVGTGLVVMAIGLLIAFGLPVLLG